MRKITTLLTLSGTIPFALLSLCLGLKLYDLPMLGSVKQWLATYAVVIASFLAGTHWGQHLHIKGFWQNGLPILSNIIALLIWPSSVLLSFKFLMLSLSCIFSILLCVDAELYKNNFVTRSYFNLRCFVSLVTVSTLVFSGYVS